MNLAFYSYKGGVGRTQTLVGVGTDLARRGKRVCLIDVDVEAPGIHHILGIKPDAHQSLLEHFIWQDMGLLPTRVIDVLELDQSPLLALAPTTENLGKLFILPCLPDREQLQKIPERNIVQFFRDSLQYLRDSFSLDYILLDSRTGFARFAPLALRCAHGFILVSRLDSQNARGMKDLLRITESKPRLLVASMVPNPDRDISDDLRAERMRIFETLSGGSIDAVIPFDKHLLLGDCLPTVQFAADHPVCTATAALTTQILEMNL